MEPVVGDGGEGRADHAQKYGRTGTGERISEGGIHHDRRMRAGNGEGDVCMGRAVPSVEVQVSDQPGVRQVVIGFSRAPAQAG